MSDRPEPLRIPDRVLFFPVTPFDSRDRVDVDVLGEHLRRSLEHRPGAVFAACGTGEVHALSAAEQRSVVAAAVEVTAAAAGHGGADRVPVLAGAGGPLGHALECARAAAEVGADALLVLPPYLVGAPQAGLVAYVEAVADASGLPVVVYHRANARLTAATAARLLRDPRVAGIKDGVGDVALAQALARAAATERERSGRDVLLFNGLLTAEVSQAAYTAVGVPLYSSAAFAMVPEVATAFFEAHRAGDDALQHRLLDGFYLPLVALRDETPGFAVSLVKAGLRLQGLPVGPVRPPLVDPAPEQESRLAALLEHGRSLLA